MRSDRLAFDGEHGAHLGAGSVQSVLIVEDLAESKPDLARLIRSSKALHLDNRDSVCGLPREIEVRISGAR